MPIPEAAPEFPALPLTPGADATALICLQEVILPPQPLRPPHLETPAPTICRPPRRGRPRPWLRATGRAPHRPGGTTQGQAAGRARPLPQGLKLVQVWGEGHAGHSGCPCGGHEGAAASHQLRAHRRGELPPPPTQAPVCPPGAQCTCPVPGSAHPAVTHQPQLPLASLPGACGPAAGAAPCQACPAQNHER